MIIILKIKSIINQNIPQGVTMKQKWRVLLFVLVSFILFSCSSKSTNENIQGYLLIIGGGKRPESVMKKFIHLAHGFENGKIFILPMASADPEGTGKYQAKQLRELGAKNVDFLIVSKDDANADSMLRKLDGVTGIFFSGGVQTRLMNAIGGTAFAEKLHKLYRSGAVIGGTSAGAAVMSKIMITGDEKRPDRNKNRAFSRIEGDNIVTAEGLGFLEDVIIDQHFVRRKRHNRLISLVLGNPKLVGMGIDESTALLVRPGHRFEVLGENSVIIYDVRNADIAPFDPTKTYNLCASNITMHVLTQGYIFDLNKNKVIAPHESIRK